MPEQSIDSKCIFHEKGMCLLHEGFPTRCRLCFNFASVHRFISKGKIKPIYTLSDYLDATGQGNILYPKDETIQDTLEL